MEKGLEGKTARFAILSCTIHLTVVNYVHMILVELKQFTLLKKILTRENFSLITVLTQLGFCVGSRRANWNSVCFLS